jgi:nucleotide-binding universal stress UspA family protein
MAGYLSHDLDVAVPGLDLPDGGGPVGRRIFVPVRSPDESAEALAVAAYVWSNSVSARLRLVHVRMYDPPIPRSPSRFYLESATEARALLDEALLILWGNGAQATTAVMDAPRQRVGAAIARQAAAWGADVIVLTRRRRPAISRAVLGSIADEVMRRATCPVLTVRPEGK